MLLRIGKRVFPIVFTAVLAACGGGTGSLLSTGSQAAGLPPVLPSSSPAVHTGGGDTPSPSSSPSPGSTPTPSPHHTPDHHPSPSPLPPTPEPTSSPVRTPEPTPTPVPTPLPTPIGGVPMYHGCPVFAAGDAYNADVTNRAIDPNSANYVNSMISNGAGQGFAFYVINPAAWQSNNATSSTGTYDVNAPSWHENDFPVPMPFSSTFFIEPQGDRHAVVVDTQNCRLYETYGTSFNGTTLNAYSGWEWDMTKPFVGTSTTTPPAGTSNPSATASGLSEFAGAFRSSDLASGAIDHALNFGVPVGSISCTAIVWPATSTGGCGGGAGPSSWAVPYGAHFRLQASFQLSCGGSCPEAQMIVRSMKTYGIYISDTGSRGTAPQMQVMSENDAGNQFDPSDINHINEVHMTDFDMIASP